MGPDRAVVEAFMAANDRHGMEAVEALLHDDFVMEWPQSGERFVGRSNAAAAMRAQVDKPQPAGEPRIVGSRDVWVAMMPLRYADGHCHHVGVLELEGGRIRRGTGYFAAPFPAQEYRADFAERSWSRRPARMAASAADAPTSPPIATATGASKGEARNRGPRRRPRRCCAREVMRKVRSCATGRRTRASVPLSDHR